MAATRLVGTSDIPQEHWAAAQLIGRTPFMASTLDPQAHASYCMYVPKQHYRIPDPSTASGTRNNRLPLIVTIHGSGRRAERARESLVALADRTGSAVLA